MTDIATHPYLDIKDYTLTLKFPLRNQGELDCAGLAASLRDVLRDWDEGRYPFDAEMISVGVGRCLKHAVYQLISQNAQDEFQHEMVPNASGNGYMSKWHLEAEKRSKVQQHPWIMSEPEVEIT